MAILISGVRVDEVPDDRCPEIAGEVCQPYSVTWYRPPTREEIESGRFERYLHNGEPMPKKETYILYMSMDVQKKLGLLHETWSWLCCQYTELSEENSRISGRLQDFMERDLIHIERAEWYLNAPWYKRIWRVLWRSG